MNDVENTQDKEFKEIEREERLYLIVADESDEFENAMYYAACKAKASGAHVAVLYVMEEQEFSHWGSVEEQMRREKRQSAERFSLEISRKIYEFNGIIPALFLEEGDGIDAITKLIRENPDVVALILGGSSQNNNPGPLVSYFTGKGMAGLSVPLMIVPDNISQERVKNLA